MGRIVGRSDIGRKRPPLGLWATLSRSFGGSLFYLLWHVEAARHLVRQGIIGQVSVASIGSRL